MSLNLLFLAKLFQQLNKNSNPGITSAILDLVLWKPSINLYAGNKICK
jgi:hypothetical protein